MDLTAVVPSICQIGNLLGDMLRVKALRESTVIFIALKLSYTFTKKLK